MHNMGKIRDILVKYSCTVTEKPTLKLPKPKNTMTSAVFASLHIYHTYEATEVSDAPLPQLQEFLLPCVRENLIRPGKVWVAYDWRNVSV